MLKERENTYIIGAYDENNTLVKETGKIGWIDAETESEALEIAEKKIAELKQEAAAAPYKKSLKKYENFHDLFIVGYILKGYKVYALDEDDKEIALLNNFIDNNLIWAKNRAEAKNLAKLITDSYDIKYVSMEVEPSDMKCKEIYI